MKKTIKKPECMINLGVTLRILRLRKGYRSAEQFSYEYDLNRTAYWRWENGENITMKNFLRLCEIHNISPKSLFELVERRGSFSIEQHGIVSEPDNQF
jgi:transcriptional regulator with XRE-family HTH domain